MPTLLVMRHAKSSWKNRNVDDHERPLNKRGKRDAARIGAMLARRELLPHAILTSSAERAHDTALRLAAETRLDLDVLSVEPSFYLAGAGEYIERLRWLPDGVERVMVVGHNPGIEELVETLGGQWERMPTAAVAHIALPGATWSTLDDDTVGRLRTVWRPKELEDERRDALDLGDGHSRIE